VVSWLLGRDLKVQTKKNSQIKQVPSESKVPQEFPIVGIGASAGGLEAFKELLEGLPVDTGLAFVIIQHLASDQESMLTDILSRFTKMPVHQVENGVHVKPDNVYVIPPGSTMTLVDVHLELIPKGKSLRPIDAFMSSLAAERKTQAIGIVLSGTGTDGTDGLKAIKAEGGITFAQTPGSSQYSGMPQSAISIEVVDFVLSPDEIAKELAKIAKNPQLVRAEIDAQEPKTKEETGLRSIFTLLKFSFNVDFSHYKETVVKRRITRRMVINHLDSISKYVDFLGTHPSELQALFNDLLIGVTSFFREPKTFDTLKEKLLPELLKNREPKNPFRIWIPGCSTGEEAYSFAIAIQEFLEENRKADVQVQIFGTDVNEKNVAKARQGVYPKSIESSVSEIRLKRFFASFNGSYQITKFIRDKCVFAKQDLTADPPFSNLDLISCRNMLIYFDSQLQERIVPILHYALKTNGFLILGESESIGKFTKLFEQIEKKGFIYTKRIGQPHLNFGFEAAAPYVGRTIPKESIKKDALVLLREEVDRLLMSEYVPASMLVNSNLDILVFRGNVTPYISPESGQTSFNVSKILRKELRTEVQTAIYKARKEEETVTEEAIRFRYGALLKTVNLKVIPLQKEGLFFLVMLEDVSAAAANLHRSIEINATPERRENAKNDQIRELKDELDSSKQTLQTVIETQEATNEELRSAIEEVQSSNEELQSTNEELETAKEELQSSNEELTTLNDELKNRNQALGILSDNQSNLAQNIDPAIVMVDCSLKIRLFTPSAEKVLNLTPSDIGLLITNVRLTILIPELDKIILKVIKTLGAVNCEVKDERGRFFEMRIRPYVTEDNKIDGAVLSFIDVNELREHEHKLQVEETKYRTLAENSPDVIARFDKNQRYLYVNSIIQEITGIAPKDFVGKTDQELGLPQKFAAPWSKILQTVIRSGKTENGELKFPTLKGTRIKQYVVVPEFSKNGEVGTVLSILKDVTEIKKAEEKLEDYRKNLEQLVEERTKKLKDSERLAALGIIAGMVGHDIRNPLQAITSDLYLAKTEIASFSDTEEKKSIKESLSEIEKNVFYINKIVSDIQDFAKPLVLKIERTNIEDIFNSVLAKLNSPKNITISYSIQKDFPIIETDQTHIQRILINLLNNAIQAMSNGGKVILSADVKSGKIVISIQDEGEGIPESVKIKLFTPLMTTKATGQGFGLAAVKKFTEALGGTVSFESELGKGTKFMIEFPR
jgi:two-component system, chemotaxis family, CheB/CheR fusion protein